MKKMPFIAHIILFVITGGLWLFIRIGYNFGRRAKNKDLHYDDNGTAPKEENGKLKEITEKIKAEQKKLDLLKSEIEKLEKQKSSYSTHEKTDIRTESSNPEIAKQEARILKLKDIYQRLKYAVDNQDLTAITEAEITEALAPTVELSLQSMNTKELRRKMNEIKREVKKVIETYEERYTTKSNLAVYRLMVIALESELQNVLYTLKYDKLENAENAIRQICIKYFSICSDGNQTIAATVKRFIAEAEYLFLNMVNVEYEYYIKQEQIKAEQAAIREQMKQEAAERKLLAEQQARLEKEEEKYKNEIENIQKQLSEADDSDNAELQARIKELEEMLSQVNENRDKITKLQHGQAGYIYVVSNLGSFGENVFKIGMTRRTDWQERINELNNASVPFPFDVHCTIFSDNAVALEHNIHQTLKENRVNKVNLRKEFFSVSADELEDLVQELQPSADFKKMLIAEQYKKSLSINEVTEIKDDIIDEEELEENIEEFALV
ncbi:MAG: GIY-YIG nuclease family protein [Eubacterium sp.]|jgi:uncharacterized protein YlxW (UPF0749 family)|nr:GIY-YIG nuclease family protein [Eubacterium sp.]